MRIRRLITVAVSCSLLQLAACTTPRETAETQVKATPPKFITGIIHKHELAKVEGIQAANAMPQTALQRADFTKGELAKLDAFAAKISGNLDCKIIVAYGCGSCCADGQRANHVNTTCGWQCWNCHGGPCN